MEYPAHAASKYGQVPWLCVLYIGGVSSKIPTQVSSHRRQMHMYPHPLVRDERLIDTDNNITHCSGHASIHFDVSNQ